jgi:hypothetical protein
MKTRIFLFALFTIFLFTTSSAQLMTLGFVKNCMTYARTTVTDELKKKHFLTVERKMESPNKLLDGATYYSNQPSKNSSTGEIAVLSQIAGSKQITEISFLNGTDNNYVNNYNDVYNQMVSFFNNETNFKSPKYGNVDVIKFTRDKNFYYVYKNKNIPTIVIANYKIDEDYFGR